MSLKLLKQSLQILEDETWGSENKAVEQHGSGTKTVQSKKVLHQKAAIVKGKVDKKHIKTNKSKPVRAVEQQQTAEQNMKRLLALSQSTIKSTDAEKIMKRIHKKEIVPAKEPEAAEQESIFTEEDFLAFEREYFST